MNWQAMAAEKRARLVSGVILIVGLASAVTIYFVAAAPVGVSESELESSKKYLRSMETYGGKANVLASELRHWLDGLWHGRRLAFTVAAITVLVAVVYRLAVMPLPPDSDGDAGDQANGDGGAS